MISYKNIELQKIDIRQKGKVKYLINGSEYFAEEAAINHYKSLGCQALWTENTYWWTLMALFFWDVIFAKTKGSIKVIISGAQTELDPSDERFQLLFKQAIQINGMPSDFFSQEFYERRKSLIKNKIQELQFSNLEQKLCESFKQNYGKKCRPIENWDKYKIGELLIAVQKLEKDKLIKILEKLISDFNNNRKGLPDLIVYNDKDFFFSEVKSEKDKISKKQEEWHDFLSTALEFKVEILFINHSEEQIKKLLIPPKSSSKEVTVSFGYTTSKKRPDAIKFVQEQESYFTQGQEKDQIHGAKFKLDETNIEKLCTILELTSGWKSQKIEIDGEIVTSLDYPILCFREKIKRNASIDYCKREEVDKKPNRLGCKNIYFYELENEDWRGYGYVDKLTGEWLFDHAKINKKIEDEIQRVKYCPIFDAEKARSVIKKIPEKINPRTDKNWAYVSIEHGIWFWHENRWLSTSGETNFPGFSSMVYIEKISKSDMNQGVKLSKWFDSGTLSDSKSQVKVKQKSGCFVATAMYGDSQVYQVLVLRYFRDRYLEINWLGKSLVYAYYKISPSIVEFIRKKQILRNIIRKTLDKIVKIIELII